MDHPYADLIGLTVDSQENGQSQCSLLVVEKLLNPHRVLHGAVLYALADTGMGAALYPSLQSGELCATIEIKINYFRPVTKGRVTCKTQILQRGKTVVNLESELFNEGNLVAKANGNYLIFTPRTTSR